MRFDYMHYVSIYNRDMNIKQLDYELEIYTIAQVILAFWLVLAYDLLEDRYTIDVIITKFFLLHFNMAERFEN